MTVRSGEGGGGSVFFCVCGYRGVFTSTYTNIYTHTRTHTYTQSLKALTHTRIGCADYTIKIINTSSSSLSKTLKGPSERVKGVAFNFDAHTGAGEGEGGEREREREKGGMAFDLTSHTRMRTPT